MPLFWISLAFLAGLLLGNILAWTWQGWLVAVVIAIALIPLFWKLYHSYSLSHPPSLHTPAGAAFFYIPPPGILIVFLPAILLGGALRYQLSQPVLDSHSLAYYDDRGPMLITGVISSEPEEYDTYTYLRIQVQQISPPTDATLAAQSPILSSQEVDGTLLVMVLPGTGWSYGDRVQLTGSIQTPPESSGFSFREYLARQNVYAYLSYPQISLLQRGQGSFFWTWIYAFKDKMLTVLYNIFPQPESALLAGILLGNDHRISTDLEKAFQATSTAHIIAISGFNIAILAGLFSTMFCRLLGTRKGAVATAIGIIFYTLLVGANPSVVRAAIMGCLGLFAAQIGRRQTGLNSLAVTALVMCLIQPELPWDVSFQLSFMATLGMILYATPLQEGFIRLVGRILPAEWAQKMAGPVGEYLLFTLAAQILTLPIMVYQFKNLSLVSLIANPLVLPVQPLVMVLSGIALIGGLIHPLIGQVLAYFAWPFVTYTIRMVEALASIPNSLVSIGSTSLWIWIIFYSLLFGLTFFGTSLLKNGGKMIRAVLKPQLVLLLTAILVVLVWVAAYSAPDGLLHLTLLSGDPPGTLLIQTPTGRSVIIVGGAMSSELNQEIGEKLPLFHREADFLVVATTNDRDLASYTLGVGDFSIQNALWARQDTHSSTAVNLQQVLAQKNIPLTLAKTGQQIELGQGATLRLISETSNGAVFLLEWENFRALLPVGTGEDQGQTLKNALAATGPVDVLLLVGSGTAASNPANEVEAFHPHLIMTDPSQQGCPANCSLLVSLPGYNLLRTDQNGWIRVTTDGQKLWVEVEKK